MPRTLAFLLTLATLSGTAVLAQSADPAVSPNSPTLQAQAAPIERVAPSRLTTAVYTPDAAPQRPRITTTQPISGVTVRSEVDAAVQTVSATADTTELRLTHGRANVLVHHPAGNTQILVDLPGGQAALLKDGLYTFNADTNTLRVYRGEADAFAGASDRAVKVKEDHQFVFGGGAVHAADLDRTQAAADLLPGAGGPEPRYRYGYGEGFYAGAPYGYGFAPYPYYAYGFGAPYGFGYPYGAFGYSYGFGLGIGFGYYGGFRGGYGGFRGFHR